LSKRKRHHGREADDGMEVPKRREIPAKSGHEGGERTVAKIKGEEYPNETSQLLADKPWRVWELGPRARKGLESRLSGKVEIRGKEGKKMWGDRSLTGREATREEGG